jgi:hypothetical protein
MSAASYFASVFSLFWGCLLLYLRFLEVIFASLISHFWGHFCLFEFAFLGCFTSLISLFGPFLRVFLKKG